MGRLYLAPRKRDKLKVQSKNFFETDTNSCRVTASRCQYSSTVSDHIRNEPRHAELLFFLQHARGGHVLMPMSCCG
jgi:hypothetical protein